MSLILNLDDMLEAMKELGMEGAGELESRMEEIGNTMATALAERLGVETGGVTSEGTAFGGTCGSFFATTEGQEAPEVLAQFDEGGDF